MTEKLSDYYRGTTPAQREARFARAMRLTTLVPLPSTNKIEPLRAPLQPGDKRPFSTSNRPCPRCGARGDYGCEHQQPYSSKVEETDNAPPGYQAEY